MRTWLRPLTKATGGSPIFTTDWVVYTFVFGGLLLDLLVVPFLLWRRTRLFAFGAAVLFNLINATIFDIGIFPWLMLGALLIFFPPDLMRRFARAFKPGTSGSEAERAQPSVSPKRMIESSACPSLSRFQKLAVGLLAAYLVVQVLLPLRHYLYPGEVNWTEEGHNFSWHMKLRTKTGQAVFTVTHPQSGQTWIINPEDYLKPHQLTKVITKPDLIVQFSQYLAEEKRREGYDNVEVRARTMVSLNGRQPQLLVDPNVDLAKEQVKLLPQSWIVPLTTPLASRSAEKAVIDTDEELP
jgi:Vitamin K-dependent gamma-carboxylase, lumenal domain/HTTM domain